MVKIEEILSVANHQPETVGRDVEHFNVGNACANALGFHFVAPQSTYLNLLAPDPANHIALPCVRDAKPRTNLSRRSRRASDLYAAAVIGERTRSRPHLLHMLRLRDHRQINCDR